MKTRKTLVRTVDLRFFQDDANGEWGLTHKETCPGNGHGEEFNAFWDGRGIFHDVFEHAHEFTDKYFRSHPYVLTTAGETVAMGALLYYIGPGGVYRDQNNEDRYISADEQAVRATADMHCDTIKGDGGSFSAPLEVCLPEQPEANETIDWAVDEHWTRVLKAKEELGSRVYNAPGKGQDPEEIARCQEFADSITLDKIRNLYRYGWHLAQQLAGGAYQNGNVLSSFITFWSQFCKLNSAEELAGYYSGIMFRLYKDKEGILSWVAQFVPKPELHGEGAKQFKVSNARENCPEAFNALEKYGPVYAD